MSKYQIYKNWFLTTGVQLITVTAIIVLVLSFTACSTVAGVGKDIQSSAEWTKDKMSGK